MMTMNRNSESPWNPGEPALITSEEYEKQVFDWLQAVGHKLENFEVTHRKNLPGLAVITSLMRLLNSLFYVVLS